MPRKWHSPVDTTYAVKEAGEVLSWRSNRGKIKNVHACLRSVGLSAEI